MPTEDPDKFAFPEQFEEDVPQAIAAVDHNDPKPLAQNQAATQKRPRPPRKRTRAELSEAALERLSARRATIPGTQNCERHRRKCQLCNHPERKAIEADFADWKRANWIEKRYNLHGKSTIYRHARATGLDVHRREILRTRVEEVLEKVDAIETPTVSAILRAVRTLASLNERGQWRKPPGTRHAVSTTSPPAESCAPSTTTAARRAPRRSPMEMISNRHTRKKLEIGATRSKQTPEAVSNRHT
jgi:hypothetical protein